MGVQKVKKKVLKKVQKKVQKKFLKKFKKKFKKSSKKSSKNNYKKLQIVGGEGGREGGWRIVIPMPEALNYVERPQAKMKHFQL
jgi:hypothetical protein